jgi:hypothetical protein
MSASLLVPAPLPTGSVAGGTGAESGRSGSYSSGVETTVTQPAASNQATDLID